MKTIEERATEYACDGRMPGGCECDSCYNIYGKCERDAYIAGAKSEHEELTRWHDPKAELPGINQMVLVKRTPDAPLPYDLAQNNGIKWVDSWCDLDINIIGWREIHDNPELLKPKDDEEDHI